MSAITPFRAAIPDADLQDLRDRLARTRWPESETVDDWSQGIPLAYVQDVCEYWRDGYDWRRFETQLNGFEQGRTTIDGVDIHVVHLRSPEPNAHPLIMTHGWPGSIAEFLDIAPALADPAAHGGDPADAFHVVLPSLPGYGFSGRPAQTGWGLDKIVAAWVELMARLSYPRFFAQGGDWGGLLTIQMGHTQAHVLDGIHLTFAVCDPAELLALGEPTAEEMGQLGRFQHYLDWENGYSQQQSTRPQTLGYGLTDSPAGQCAWILEKFRAWTDCDGHPENVLARDKLLDNITLYWLTATATSSARLYWQSFKGVLADYPPIAVPTGYTLFPKDLFAFSERWMRTRFKDLRHYGEMAEGGHFASLEQPEAFVEEVRTAFRTMR